MEDPDEDLNCLSTVLMLLLAPKSLKAIKKMNTLETLKCGCMILPVFL